MKRFLLVLITVIFMVNFASAIEIGNISNVIENKVEESNTVVSLYEFGRDGDPYRKIPSGVYFYKLLVNGESRITKKLNLIKLFFFNK